ncbi:glycoside hydrolase family 2 protein [Cellulosilyticum sp. I15G10I2]|uniref:glycoside hydrolase family 2 protein n=1 Tax=Cellulosilyticum sp. I15G10I2 TaxID=1892843 RepID=UPI00085CA506|nr:glycoside hydrolase family 2 [Cellulosilyticum sp. I15G10I2]
MEINNFVGNIHDSNYDEKYYKQMIDHEMMVYDRGREKEKLNGYWHFCIDVYDSCLRSEWYLEKRKDDKGRDIPIDFDFDGWEETVVPSVWNTQKPEYFYYEGPAVYSRKFNYQSQGEDKVIIKFGAVYYEAKVFVNGEFVGCHKGGSTPFYIDVTHVLKEENRIIVVVDNTRKKEQIPTINTDWFNYGGIYRDVEMIRLPKAYIKDFSLALDNDSLDTIVCEVEINEENSDTIYLEIPELEIKQSIPLEGKIGKLILKPEQIKLWSPESPYLYDVKLQYGEDIIHEKIGFRQVKVRGNAILLNDQPIYLNGICVHEESIANGKAITDEEIIENIKLAKELNCNYMRLAHYPHTERAAQLADELGIMLWEEIPVYWAIEFDNSISLEDAKNQLTELIKRDKNRASVISWSVGNENPDTDSRLTFMSKLAILAKKLDPTRLITAACLVNHVDLKIEDRLEEYLDVMAINEYYGWYDPDFNKLTQILENSNPNKPVIISEFGGDGKAGHHGTIHDLGTETFQENIFKKQVEIFQKTLYIKGTTPWILYDFRSPRRHAKYQEGYNIKGLLSKDKKHKKLAFYIMQTFYKSRQ